jgi:hypothetical protein
MQPWMADIGKRTPNGWALQQLKEIITGRAGAADLAAPVVMIAAVIAVLLWTCSRRLKGGFAQG